MNKFLFAFTALIAVSCSNNSSSEAESKPADTAKTVVAAITPEELLIKINSNNDALGNLSNVDSLRFICRAQTELCNQYVRSNPNAPDAPDILGYQAKAFRVLGMSDKAVDSYTRIETSYPNYQGLPEVMFLKAFLLDEDLGEKDRAKEAYNRLIQKFPDHPFSKDAKVLLTQLYMSDEEMIKMLKK